MPYTTVILKNKVIINKRFTHDYSHLLGSRYRHIVIRIRKKDRNQVIQTLIKNGFKLYKWW